MKKWGGIGGFFCVALIIYFCMGTRPMVSVVMSTYNRSEQVEQTIQSVLNQTYSDFDFIIINDGSTDNTADVLEKYAQKDNRIQVLHNEKNKGLIASLNLGLQMARGQYIARIDDDDKMLPTRLEKQVAYMEKHPHTAVLATGIRTMKKGQKRADLGCPSPSDQVLINMHFANGIAHPSTLLRTSFLKKQAIKYNPDYPAAEDYKLWQDVLLAGGQIDCLQEQLTEYETGSGHSADFYQKQRTSSRAIRLIFLNRLFPATDDTLNAPYCFLLEKMIQENKTTRLLNQELLLQKKEYDCGTIEKSYLVSHPGWTDHLIPFGKNRIKRASNHAEMATILSNTDGILTLKWDRWGKESFMCDNNQKCVFVRPN